MARFTNPIDPAGFDESLVTIYPPLPGARFSLSGETIAIRGRSKGRSKYKVRFGQALRDKFGQTLESAAEAEVEIDAAEPMLFPEERTMVVLDPAFAPALNVYSVNRNELQGAALRRRARRLSRLRQVPPGLGLRRQTHESARAG